MPYRCIEMLADTMMSDSLRESTRQHQATALLARFRRKLLETLRNFARGMGYDQPAVLDALLGAAAACHDDIASPREQREFARTFAPSLQASRGMVKLAYRLHERCGEELSLLHGAYAVLLDQGDSVAEQVPIGPETVCYGLHALCEAANLNADEQISLIAAAASRLARHMHKLYHAFNNQIFATGLVAPPSALPPVADAGAGRDAVAEGDDPFAALRDRLGGPAESDEVAPPTLDPSLSAALLDQVRRWLAEFAAEQAARPRAEPVRLDRSELAPLLSSAIASTAGSIERILDQLAVHPDLPAAARQVFINLHIPLLRLALDDADVLADAGNPARRLLDTVASFASGFADGEPPPTGLVRLNIVLGPLQRVALPGPDHVDAAVDQVAFLAEQTEEVAMALIEPAMPAAERLDRRADARAVAADALGRLAGERTPEAVRAFLAEWWAPALAHVFCEHGGEHSSWHDMMDVARRLIASGHRPANADERARLTGELPGLIRAIHEGLSAMGLDAAARDHALQPCMAMHAARLQGKRLPAVAAMTAASSRLAANEDEPSLLYLHCPPQRGAHERPALLKAGDVVDIRLLDGAPIRARAMWVGPLGRVALFVDSGGERVFVAELAALDALIQSGEARLIDGKGIVTAAAWAALRQLDA